MATASYSEAQLLAALEGVGIAPGATMVVHSSLFHLGRLEGVALAESAARIVALLRDHLGPEGTLAVPASNWDYGRKREPFDLRRSPVTKALGVLSQQVAALPESRRSPNPIFSVAAVGAQADFICGGGTASAMGPDSAWDRLYRLNAENLFLGCDLTYLSFVRYIEYLCGVPYIYNKLFDVPLYDDGRPLGLTVVTPLRYAHCPAEHDISRFEQRLRQRGVLREIVLGSGPVKAVRMDDCFKLGVEALKEDIHFFLAGPPAYQPGQVPLA
jgi:aminoglycoside 3-N-acetyltransferase